jgi:hypothetical protein
MSRLNGRPAKSVRAERKCGQLTRQIPKASTRQRIKSDHPTQSAIEAKGDVLKRNGISKDQASAWEKLADIPDADFERHVTLKGATTSGILARRNLKKGQQAMALAMIYPEPEKGGRGHKKERVDETSMLFSSKRLQIARIVLRHSRALAEDVLADRKSLDAALDIVNNERERSSSTEAKIMKLQRNAPDLAELLTDEGLDLDEACAAYTCAHATN